MITVFQVTAVLHPIGMACASLVIVTLLGLTIYDRSLVNRVTLRLIGMVALADIFTHTKDYLIKNYRTDDNLCIFISALTYFSTYLYCFTNIAVAYNFQRTFIQNKGTTFKFELMTWIIVIAVCLGITLLFWLLGTFGYDPIQRKCVGISGNWIFYLRGHFQWILCSFTVLYCTIVICLIHFRLKYYVNDYLNSKLVHSGSDKRLKKEITQLIQRGLLYPLSPIITQPPMIAYMSYYLLHNNSTDAIQWWLGISYGLSGILTFIAFFIDVTLLKAIKTVYFNIRYRGRQVQHMKYYDLGPNALMDDVDPEFQGSEITFKLDKQFFDLTKEL